MLEETEPKKNDIQARRDAGIALGCAFAVALLAATGLLIYLW